MSQPLESIRVLDLTRLLPGPYCTMLLADFGADVIKVEAPGAGDYARWNGTLIDGDSAMFHSLNRNKKSVVLNLKEPDGKDIFLRMAEQADVVIESFRPGVMDRLGIGYETLKAQNPKLVYCALTGYGQNGPYSSMPGHDINYLSYSGLLNLQGEQDRKPVSSAAQIADMGGGALPAALGIMLALFDREKTGNGQFVDIAMLDGVVSWLQSVLPEYLADQKVPKRGEPELSGGKACYGVYETKDGRYLSVGALEPKFWRAFCTMIGKENLIAKQNASLREQNHMKAEIQDVISERTLADWMDQFSETEACVAPLHNLEEMSEDPHIIAREMIQTVAGSMRGVNKQVGHPIKMSETPGSIRTPAPKLGEHTHKILQELGFSEDQMEQFKAKEIF